MTVIFAVELVLSLVLSLGFVLLLGPPQRNADPHMAWFLAATAWIAVAFDLVLLALLFDNRVPLWVVAVVLGGQDVAVGWRLWLLLKGRQIGERTMSIAKAIVGALIAGLGTLATALADDNISKLEIVAIASTILVTLYGVWQVPNRPAP